MRMPHQHTEPIRGKAELITDGGTGWAFAPSGTKRPFDRKIRILLLKHLEDGQIRAQWGKRTYTLRYDSDIANHVQSWKVGSRHRVQMWGDRIDRVLPKSAKDDDL